MEHQTAHKGMQGWVAGSVVGTEGIRPVETRHTYAVEEEYEHFAIGVAAKWQGLSRVMKEQDVVLTVVVDIADLLEAWDSSIQFQWSSAD